MTTTFQSPAGTLVGILKFPLMSELDTTVFFAASMVLVLFLTSVSRYTLAVLSKSEPVTLNATLFPRLPELGVIETTFGAVRIFVTVVVLAGWVGFATFAVLVTFPVTVVAGVVVFTTLVTLVALPAGVVVAADTTEKMRQQDNTAAIMNIFLSIISTSCCICLFNMIIIN